MKDKTRSLRFKIIVIITCFSSFIAFVVSILSYNISHRYLEESLRQSTYISLQLVGNEINSDLDSVLIFTGALQLDPDIERYLSEIESHKNRDIADYRQFSMETWRHLNEEYSIAPSHDLITRFVVSTPDGSDFLHIVRTIGASSSDIPKDIMSLDFFTSSVESQGYRYIGLIQSPLALSQDSPVLPILRPVKSSVSPEILGWIYVEADSEFITDHIDNLGLPEDSSIYITFDGNITYRYDNGSFIETVLSDSALADMSSYTLPGKGITLMTMPSASERRMRTRTQTAIVFAVLVFIMLSGIFIYMLLRRMINKPVDALLLKLGNVGKGDFKRDEGIEWDNEFGEIGRGINDLADDVNKLINSKIEDERTRQALEYRILQSQINPHFMYNTLNTIKWMATIQGAEGIADMSTALSRLLKNVSKVSDNLIPLRDELALLDDYYTIMKYRYGGTVEMEYDIEDECLLDCMITRFSLQPIVENAIFHGIEPKGSAGRIDIHIYGDAGVLHIDVTDNGIGMDEGTLDRVLHGRDDNSPNDFFKDVGVANVANRIRFAFGDEYGLTASSEVGKYTTISIYLPITVKDKEA